MAFSVLANLMSHASANSSPPPRVRPRISAIVTTGASDNLMKKSRTIGSPVRPRRGGEIRET